MMAIPDSLQGICYWLVNCSFYATILLVLILAVRSFAQRYFRFRIIYWLWILLLLRLIWPLNFQSSFSLFNLIPGHVMPTQYFSSPAAGEQNVETNTLTNDVHDLKETDQATGLMEDETIPPAINTDPSNLDSGIQTQQASTSSTSSRFDFSLSELLCILWLGGAGLLGLYVMYNNLRLWRIIKSQRLITDQTILELLEDCKHQMGIQTVIGVVQTEKINSPCLFGYLRPRLLLPEGTLQKLTNDQIRYVFLHELAHLKRHDILIGWWMAFVQILHWFNPAVWYAMTLIHRDRELACDELALSTLGEEEPAEYGNTLLAFLEQFSRKQSYPGMAGIAESKSLLRRRMNMISQFKKQKLIWMPVLIMLIVLFAVTFTSAIPQDITISRTLDSGSAEIIPMENDNPSLMASEPSGNSRSSNGKPVILSRDDGKTAGKKSIAGSGHAVYFETSPQSELIALMIYGSRYGANLPPSEKFSIWLCDMNQDVIQEFQFPYGTFKKGDPKWVKMRVEATSLPEQFYLCAGFNPEQTKGVFVHYDGQGSGNSYTGLPGQGFSEFEDGDWMIRAVTRQSESQETTEVSTTDNANNTLQALIDAAPEGGVIDIPDGIYEQPLLINKTVIVRGTSPEKCIIKVTSDEPAIMIDTQGKGQVGLQNITIQWQLQTSGGKYEYPNAVSVKDTKATIENCMFRPLGNPQRSPVAIQSYGFTEMTISGCDFKGFDYVICYGEGTKGKMHDSVIRDCGHQGVILYSSAQADIYRNIISGSKFHAVRVTGGKLNLHDNIIINNKNRGVYLGNKSGSGQIVNNLIIGNANGIDGVSACKFSVENNIILKSTHAAIAARPYSLLNVQGNILSMNPKGIIVFQKEGESEPVRSKFGANILWKNQTDMENCESTEIIEQEPEFIEPAEGNYKLANESSDGMGLKDPKVIFDLWQKYKEIQ